MGGVQAVVEVEEAQPGVATVMWAKVLLTGLPAATCTLTNNMPCA